MQTSAQSSRVAGRETNMQFPLALRAGALQYSIQSIGSQWEYRHPQSSVAFIET